MPAFSTGGRNEGAKDTASFQNEIVMFQDLPVTKSCTRGVEYFHLIWNRRIWNIYRLDVNLIQRRATSDVKGIAPIFRKVVQADGISVV